MTVDIWHKGQHAFLSIGLRCKVLKSWCDQSQMALYSDLLFPLLDELLEERDKERVCIRILCWVNFQLGVGGLC